MKIVNGIVYVIVFLLVAVCLGLFKGREKQFPQIYSYIKEHIRWWIILLIINTISFGIGFRGTPDSIFIEKDGYSGEEQQIPLMLKHKETTEEIILNVRPKKLTAKEYEKKKKEAFSYIEKNIKGKNESLLEIRDHLNFTIDYEKYPFDIEFQPEDYRLIDESGNVKNTITELENQGFSKEEVKHGISTNVLVTLWYGEKSEEQNYEFLIFPKEEKKVFTKLIKDFKGKEEEALYKSGFYIPAEMDGIRIMRKDEHRISSFEVFLIGIFLIVILNVIEKEKLKEQEKEKKIKLLKSYPWFINELVLLLGAGMQVKNIFTVFIQDYEAEKEIYLTKEKKRREEKDDREVLIEELAFAKRNIELGISEEEVYYQLGRRIKLPCYIKIMTMLEQNVRRGNKGLIEKLEQEEVEAFEERKNMAKRYGEEAGTKLLGPLILLLLIIMFMIMIPAFLSFYSS